MNGNVIEIRDLHAMGRHAALGPVTLCVAEGEGVAVVGPHQPTLSLLVRVCAGFERVQSGTVRVCGVDVAVADRRTLLELRRVLGYVSISGGLLANMTLRGNIELALRYHGASERSARARVDEAIEAVGLMDSADVRAGLVPAELVKCFAYLRALLLEPRVLMAEDPSAFLHPQGRAIVARLHARARTQGITVLVADDDEGFVAPLVDRVIGIEQLEAS